MPELPILAYNFVNARDDSVVATLLKNRIYQHGDIVADTIPASTSAALASPAHNRIAFFNGDMYVNTAFGLKKLNRSGTNIGVWDIVDTPFLSGGFDAVGPLYSVIAAGTPTLFYTYRGSGNDLFARWSIDGVTFNSVASSTLSSSSEVFKDILYQNSLFIKNPVTPNGMLEFNFVSKTWIQYQVADLPGATFANAGKNGSFFIYGGSLYYGQYQNPASTTSLYRIWEFNGTAWDITLTTDFGVLNSGVSQAALTQTSFVYNDKIYIIGLGEVGGADLRRYCLEVDLSATSPTVTEIGATVFRPYFRKMTSFQTTTFHGHIVDNVTDPQNPVIYYYRRSNRSQSTNGRNMSRTSIYRWNGPNAVMTYLYNVEGGWALPYGANSYNNSVQTSELRSIEFTDDLNFIDSSTVEFRFQVKGGTSTGVKIQLLYNVNEEQPTTVATLTGTPTGGSITRNVNTLENVDASDVNEYVARWDIGTDLVNGGDQISTKLQVVA